MDDKNLAPLQSNRGAPARIAPSGSRVCILVLGMHRSGTSAVTRVISLLGAALPKNLMPPRPGDNESGFWEPRDLWTLNDRMLADAGSRWDDWRRVDLSAIPVDRLESHKGAISRSITDDFADARLIVLKDPRVCRVVPRYIEWLSALGYECRCVLVVRDPLAVIASLQRRNGMTHDFAALLWLRHMLDAEAATRSMVRVVVSYDAMLVDWRRTVATLIDGLGVDFPYTATEAETEITKFLSTDRHSASPRRDTSTGDAIERWITDAYTALLDLADHSQQRECSEQPDKPDQPHNPDHDASHRALDRIRKEFDAVSTAFGGVFFAELGEREKHFESELARLAGHNSSLQMQADEKEALIQRLAAELDQRQRVIDDLARECAERLRVSEERRLLIHQLTDAVREHESTDAVQERQ